MDRISIGKRLEDLYKVQEVDDEILGKVIMNGRRRIHALLIDQTDRRIANLVHSVLFPVIGAIDAELGKKER